MVRFASAMRAAVVVILAAAAGRAQAADLVPLKHGVFVSKDVGCGDAANAVSIAFDGQALSVSGATACHSTLVNKIDKTYIVKTDCAKDGNGSAVSETLVLEREKATVFRLISRSNVSMPGGPVVYQWCSAGQAQ